MSRLACCRPAMAEWSAHWRCFVGWASIWPNVAVRMLMNKRVTQQPTCNATSTWPRRCTTRMKSCMCFLPCAPQGGLSWPMPCMLSMSGWRLYGSTFGAICRRYTREIRWDTRHSPRRVVVGLILQRCMLVTSQRRRSWLIQEHGHTWVCLSRLPWVGIWHIVGASATQTGRHDSPHCRFYTAYFAMHSKETIL